MIFLDSTIKPVFVYDFETIYTYNGVKYLKDKGPYGLDAAFPGGANDPSEQNDGSYSFGVGDYLTLSLRFYQYAPTGSISFISIFKTAIGVSIFSCYNFVGGLAYGVSLNTAPSSTSDQMNIMQLQAGATFPTLKYSITNKNITCSKNLFVGSLDSVGIGSVNSLVMSPTWDGAFGTIIYDITYSPRICADFVGSVYYLALLPRSLSYKSIQKINEYLRQGIKPWAA